MSLKEFFKGKQEYIAKGLAYTACLFILYFLLAHTSKALNNSFYILMLAPTLLIINKIELKQLWKSLHFKIFTLFCLWMGISVLWSGTVKASEVKYVLYVYIYVLGVSYAYRNRDKVSEKLLYAFLSLTLVVPLFVYFTNDKSRLKGGHGLFESALTGGNVLCFFIIVAFSFLFHYKKARERIWICTSLASMLLLLSYTNSRSSVLATAIGIGVFVIFKFASKKLIVSLSALGLVSVIFLCFFLHHKNWFRFSSGEDTITYQLSDEKADKLIITKTMIENKQWDGTFKEIMINGHAVDFEDSLKIEIPINDPISEIQFTSADTGIHPFKCFTIELTQGEKEIKSINITPPRLLYIDLSLNIRTTTWSKFIEIIKESPIIGHGLSQKREAYVDERDIYYTDTHNMMIGTTLRGGLVALALWLFFIGSAFIVLFKSKNHLLFALLTAGFFFTLFDDDNFFHSPLPYWLCMLIPLACSFVIKVEGKDEGLDK
jgi:O-antigen ligase